MYTYNLLCPKKCPVKPLKLDGLASCSRAHAYVHHTYTLTSCSGGKPKNLTSFFKCNFCIPLNPSIQLLSLFYNNFGQSDIGKCTQNVVLLLNMFSVQPKF